VVLRRGRPGTVYARGSDRALSRGPSTSPLDGMLYAAFDERRRLHWRRGTITPSCEADAEMHNALTTEELGGRSTRPAEGPHERFED
jgi:hypothetical protein